MKQKQKKLISVLIVFLFIITATTLAGCRSKTSDDISEEAAVL